MSYLSISKAATDGALRNRIAACVAGESSSDAHPLAVTDTIQWKCAAEPGWGEAWASAEAAQESLPEEDRKPIGLDESVITDAMILSAVQKNLGLSGAAQTPV